MQQALGHQQPACRGQVESSASRLAGRARPTSRPRARSRPSSSAAAAPRPRWRRIAGTTPASPPGRRRPGAAFRPNLRRGPGGPRRRPRLAGRSASGAHSVRPAVRAGEGQPDRIDALRADRLAGAAEHAGLERGAQGLGGRPPCSAFARPMRVSSGSRVSHQTGQGAGRARSRCRPRRRAAGGSGLGRHQKITSRFRIMAGSAARFRARWLSTTSSPSARRM